MIHRAFVSKNIDLKIRAFTAYVRPLLEYSSAVWNPHLLSDIVKIEKVQRRFTKRILFQKGLSYPERLKVLKLQSLELRRIHADAVQAFKILRGPPDIRNSFYAAPPSSSTRSNNREMLYIPKFRLDTRQFSFSIRSAKIWNLLPDNIKNSSLYSFKKIYYRLIFVNS